MNNIIEWFYKLFNKTNYDVFDVFTPATEARLTFVERPIAERDLKNALRTHGRQIILYGHSGSGKTTLIKNTLEKTERQYITTSCEQETTLEELILSAFDKLNPYYLEEKANKFSGKINSELKASYLGIESKINAERSFEDSTKLKRVIPIQLTPQRLAEFFGAIDCYWIVEDFHKVKGEERNRLAHIMKIFKDVANKDLQTKIIAIGAVGSPREILEYDTNLKDRVAEVEVPLMNEREIKEILNKGEELMNIQFEKEVSESIINLSNGLASVCHHICLNICTNNNLIEKAKKGKVTFSNEALDKAVNKYVNEQSDSLKSIFDKAVKEGKNENSNNGELIVKSLLNLNSEEVTFLELLEEIRETKSNFSKEELTLYLDSMVGPERGEIIRYDEDANKYSFSNPFFNVYAMMKLGQAEKKEDIKIINSKNIVVQSHINVGRDVHIGDVIINNKSKIEKQININTNDGDINID